MSNDAEAQPYGTYDLPDPNGPQVEALIGGQLVYAAGCIYLESEGQRYLPIFPHQHTKYEAATQTVIILGHRLEMGSDIQTNGGYSSFEDITQLRLISPIPETCASSTVVTVGTESWVSKR